MEAPKPDLANLWTLMDNEKGPKSKYERYAYYTFPALWMPDGTENTNDVPHSYSALGPIAVNHLSNIVASVMFPTDHPFFIVEMTEEAKLNAKQNMEADVYAEEIANVTEATAALEKVAAEKFNLVSFLPKAVEAVKNQIVLGNVLIFRQDDEERIIFGLKNYCVRRRLDTSPYEIMLREATRFGDLSDTDKQRLRMEGNKEFKDEDKVTHYTHFYQKKKGGRWDTRYAVEGVELPKGKSYIDVEFPCIVLAWSLASGEHYGRGLIEENRTVFHALDVSELAFLDMTAIVSDVKFFAKSGSMLDVSHLNQSARGSWHVGSKEDIGATNIQLANEMNAVQAAIDKWEKRISMTFMLTSSSIRDAERVTAEEIRLIARELNKAFGGLYSRLAVTWQAREANYLVHKLEPKLMKDHGGLKIRATTGYESLTREGRLASLVEALSDSAVLDGVPEDIRAAINPQRLLKYIMTQRQVPYDDILYTPSEIQANNDRAAAMEQQQMLAQAGANVAEAAGTEAMKE